MKKTILAVFAAIAVVFGGVVAVPAAANAENSDSPTTYSVTPTGVYLADGDVFQAHGHINWKTNRTSGGMHFDPNNGHPGGEFIGKSYFPIALSPGECITWVQISHHNAHFGEGGQKPVCNDTPPPFDGVEKYTPTYNVTCEGVTFSHPAIKTGLGVANVYGIRYGATQAEAQAKEFEAYTPGTVVTYSFADKYVSNTFYFEVKVGFDGVNLKQQIGQTRGVSEACEKPIPPKPEAITGDEQRTSDPVCVVPANGTEVSYLENRIWTQDFEFDSVSWTWVPTKRVYDDWTVVDTIVTKNEKCDPPKPIEEPKKETPKQQSEELAVTGGPDVGATLLFGGLLLAAMGGITLMGRRIIRKNR